MMSNQLLFYYQLQFQRFRRFLKHNGIYPAIAIPFLLLVFILGSVQILNTLSFGEYIYGALALSVVFMLFDPRRNAFLKRCNTKRDFLVIRLTEVILLLLPFFAFLMFFDFTALAFGICFLSIISLFSQGEWQFPYAIPTPFGQRPFEFTRGFRIGLLPIIGSYTLVLIGLGVGNFNLAIAGMAAIGLICGYFYVYPEPRSLVWIFSKTPQQFLASKSRIVVINIFILLFPIVLLLIAYDATRYLSVVLMLLACIGFVEMCMLAKYVVFPTELNLIQGFAIGFSILMPPLIILIIPIFYWQATKRLNQVLI